MKRFLLLALAVSAVVPALSAGAATYNWTDGAGDGLWSSVQNWTVNVGASHALPGGTLVTGNGDVTQFLDGFTNGRTTFTTGATTQSLGRISFGDGLNQFAPTLTANLTINGTFTLTGPSSGGVNQIYVFLAGTQGTENINATTILNNTNTTAASFALVNGSTSTIVNLNGVVTSAVASGTVVESFTKTGVGTLVMNTANSFSGTFTAAQGVTIINNANAFPMNPGTYNTVFVGSASTSSSLLTNSVNLANPVTVNSAGGGVVTIGGAPTNTATTWSGAIFLNQNPLLTGGTGTATFTGGMTTPVANKNAITKIDAGTVVLADTNAYFGATSIASGTLVLDFSQATSPVSNIVNTASPLVLGGTTTTVGMIGGGTLKVVGNANANNVQQVANLSINPAASSIVVANNSTNNNQLVSLGGVTRTAQGGIVDFTLPSGTQGSSNGIFTAAQNVNGIIGGYATVGGTDWAVSAAPAPAYTNVAWTTPNAGTNSGVITFTLATPPANGTRLVMGGTAATGFTSVGYAYYVVNSTGGTTFNLATSPGGAAIATTGSNSGSGNFVSLGLEGPISALPSASYLADAWGATANTTFTTSTDFSATPGLTSNSLRFNSGTAPTTIALAGTNVITSGGVLVTPNVGANAVLITGGSITGGPNNPGLLTGAAGQDLIVNQNNTSAVLTISSTIVDNTIGGGTKSTGFTKTGAGRLILAATNTYSGSTFLDGGITQLNGSAVIPTGAGKGNVTVNTSAILDANGNSITINGLAGAGVVDNISAGGNVVLSLGNNSVSSTFLGVIQNTSGTLSLNKIGTGTQTLLGANTYTGATTISAGVLQLGSGNTTTAALQNAGGSIGNTSGVSGNGTLQFTYSNGVYGFAPPITGNVGVSVVVGTIELTGNDTYSGATTVAAGSALCFGNGSTGSVNNITTVTTATNGFIMFDLPSSTTYSGTIAGTGGVGVLGAGTLTVTGTIGSTGSITTEPTGTLQIGNGGTTGTVAAAAAYIDKGSLIFNHSTPLTISSVISGDGRVEISGAGTVTYSAANTYAGNTTIDVGSTLVFTGSTSTVNIVGGTGSITTINGTLIFNRSATANCGIIIGGNGSIQQIGSTIELINNNPFSGTVNLVNNSSNLLIGNGGSVGTLDNATVTGSGLFGWFLKAGVVDPAGTTITGGVTTDLQSAGTVIILGNNSYTGQTYIDLPTSVMVVGNGGATGSLGNTSGVTNVGILAFNRSDVVTFIAPITGTGSLIQSGPGTLILNSPSLSYSGGTTVAGGTLELPTPLALPAPTSGANATLLAGGTLSFASTSSPHTFTSIASGYIAFSGGKLDPGNNDILLTGGVAEELANRAIVAPTAAAIGASGATVFVTSSVLSGTEYTTLTGNTTFDSVTFAGTDLIVRYGLAGDIAGSGNITVDDYVAIDNGFAKGLTGYANGDFNHDGVVNAADYALIDTNYASQGGSLAAQFISEHTAEFGSVYVDALQFLAPTEVPEPASLLFLATGTAGLLRRRRKP